MISAFMDRPFSAAVFSNWCRSASGSRVMIGLNSAGFRAINCSLSCKQGQFGTSKVVSQSTLDVLTRGGANRYIVSFGCDTMANQVLCVAA